MCLNFLLFPDNFFRLKLFGKKLYYFQYYRWPVSHTYTRSAQFFYSAWVLFENFACKRFRISGAMSCNVIIIIIPAWYSILISGMPTDVFCEKYFKRFSRKQYNVTCSRTHEVFLLFSIFNRVFILFYIVSWNNYYAFATCRIKNERGTRM